MTKKKIMMTAMSAGLVAVVGVGGTLAYLSAQSGVVNNTFTVGTGYVPDEDGNVGIVLDEAKVMEDGTVDASIRYTGEQTYPKLMPGDTKLKDPTVRFVAGSVKSYVFAKVEGADFADGNYLTIDGWNTNDWKKVVDSDGETPLEWDTTGDGIYMYVGALADDNNVIDIIADDPDTVEVEGDGRYVKGQDIQLGYIFNSISFDNVQNDEFESVSPDFNKTSIKISACAVQAANDGSTWEDGLEEAKFAE